MMIMCMLISVPVSAASLKSQAKKAYNTYMAGKHPNLKFALIYLDNNSVPELVVNDGTIYTYKKSSGVSLLQDDYEFDYKKYYKKQGVIYSEIIAGAIMDYDVFYYQRVSKGKLVHICRQEHYKSGKWIYYNPSFKKISKSKCNKQIKKYTGKKKATKLKYYLNTASKRAKYLK